MGGGALAGLGGLGGILGKLKGAGLGNKADSWVGTGANEDVDPDELEAALGKDQVAKLAAEAGVSHDEAKSGLSALLPKVVDHVTPQGQLPGGDQLGGLLGKLDLGQAARELRAQHHESQRRQGQVERAGPPVRADRRRLHVAEVALAAPAVDRRVAVQPLGPNTRRGRRRSGGRATRPA